MKRVSFTTKIRERSLFASFGVFRSSEGVLFFTMIVAVLLTTLPSAAVNLDLSSAAKWNSGKADGANLTYKEIDGEKGKGISMSFDLSSGDWIQMWQDGALDLTGISAVRLHVRCDGSKNRLEVKLVDADGTNFGARLEELAFDNQWHEITVPFPKFTYFWGGDDKLDQGKITSVWLAVAKMDGGTGEIAIDQVELVTSSSASPASSPTAAKSTNGLYKLQSADFAKLSLALDPTRRDPATLRVKLSGADHGLNLSVVDETGKELGQVRLVGEGGTVSASAPSASSGGYQFDMESKDEWTSGKADGVELNVAQTAGQNGNAVELQYKMSAGEWLQIWQEKSMELSPDQNLFVRFKLSGSKNRVEIKLVDADGTNFGLKFEDLTPSDAWIEKTAPLKSFTYFWGGDDKMDWPHTISLWIAVSKIDAGEGKLVIDEIRLGN